MEKNKCLLEDPINIWFSTKTPNEPMGRKRANKSAVTSVLRTSADIKAVLDVLMSSRKDERYLACSTEWTCFHKPEMQCFNSPKWLQLRLGVRILRTVQKKTGNPYSTLLFYTLGGRKRIVCVGNCSSFLCETCGFTMYKYACWL